MHCSYSTPKFKLFFSFSFSLKVEGIFYINELLEKLMFDELKNWAGTQGTVL